MWKSDGTTAETVLVKDINPGTGNSGTPTSASPMAYSGGLVYLVANNGPNGNEVWRSDGTEAGTFLLKDINPLTTFIPFNLTAFEGGVVFGEFSDVFGTEIWKSDGTTAGTVLLKDITPGPSGTPFLAGFAVFENKLYFPAASDLWTSDGTEAGTTRLFDFGPGQVNTSVLIPSGPGEQLLFFRATDVTTGIELWKTDGTQDGTALVLDINLQNGLTKPNERGRSTALLFSV